jgi:hypothetical protein
VHTSDDALFEKSAPSERCTSIRRKNRGYSFSSITILWSYPHLLRSKLILPSVISMIRSVSSAILRSFNILIRYPGYEINSVRIQTTVKNAFHSTSAFYHIQVYDRVRGDRDDPQIVSHARDRIPFARIILEYRGLSVARN